MIPRSAQYLDPMLPAAGFRIIPVDTPAKTQILKSLPPLKVSYYLGKGRVQAAFETEAALRQENPPGATALIAASGTHSVKMIPSAIECHSQKSPYRRKAAVSIRWNVIRASLTPGVLCAKSLDTSTACPPQCQVA